MKTLSIWLLMIGQAWAAGVAHDANFLVMTEEDTTAEAAEELAEHILRRANELRSEIALEWFGEEIPRGFGRASINLHYREGEESALTWAKDSPTRTLHAVYLRTTSDRAQIAVEEMLPHEILHVVMATRYPHPNRLPLWIEEGMASQLDDGERKQLQKDSIRWMVSTGRWHGIGKLMLSKKFVARNAEAYAASASVVRYLMSLKSEDERHKALLDFAERMRMADGQVATVATCEAALREVYGIQGIEHLQVNWQDWTQGR